MIHAAKFGLKLTIFAALCAVGWAGLAQSAVTSATVVVNKSPAVFYTGRNIQPRDVRINVNTDSAAHSFGLEPGMQVRIDLVAAPSGNTPFANELSTETLAWDVGVATLSPVFHVVRPFTGDSAVFRIQVLNASNQLLATAHSTATINVYDFDSTALEILVDNSDRYFKVNSTVNISAQQLRVLVLSTEPVNGGLEDWMQVHIDLVDGSNTIIPNGVSDIVPELVADATSYLPRFYPKYAYASRGVVKFQVRITRASDQSILIPRFGTNPSIGPEVGVPAGHPSKLVILPLDQQLIRPDSVGRPAYDESNPLVWSPVAFQETLQIRVIPTDSWSNPITISSTSNELVFSAPSALTLPPPNSIDGTKIVLSTGFEGTVFSGLFVDPWEIPVPITVQSLNGFGSDTIYVMKQGLPKEKMFVGPSPFNPKVQTTRFRFFMDQDIDVKILVLNIFGHKVWEKSESVVAGEATDVEWDGRNDRGDLVAAGVYWAVLEKNGKWVSKKKFGVVK